MRAPPLVLLMALARQVTHFLVHHQVHQLQPGLPQQVSYSLLQQTDDVGHRKDHLHVGILFGGEPAELLHGSLLFDLISFLHSDSLLFSWQKNNRRPIMAASLRVAYFLRIYGQSRCGAYPARDRAAIESVMVKGFHFTSQHFGRLDVSSPIVLVGVTSFLLKPRRRRKRVHLRQSSARNSHPRRPR